MKESKLKDAVIKMFKDNGAFCIKISDRYTNGVPDLNITYNTRSIWIELKRKEGSKRLIQVWTMEQIRKNGGEAYICRSLENARRILSLPKDTLLSMTDLSPLHG